VFAFSVGSLGEHADFYLRGSNIQVLEMEAAFHMLLQVRSPSVLLECWGLAAGHRQGTTPVPSLPPSLTRSLS